jgi:hypothetical protein
MANKTFGLYPDRKTKPSLVQQLMKVPPKETKKNMPKRHARFTAPGYIQQADLLFLPTDPDGSKYALVVVDIATGIVDAEPLANKSQDDVLKAFQQIYKRKILTIPKALLQVDQGTEFKGNVANWFSDNNVMIRRGQAGRHRQQANVEAKNKIIARALFLDMHEKELETGETVTDWVENLPQVIKIINNHTKKTKKHKYEPFKDTDIRCDGKSCTLLKKGTKVRRILDEPRDPGTNTKLIGKFRATDTRWENKERKIEGVILHPDQPPMYQISGMHNVLYTREQLQIIQ